MSPRKPIARHHLGVEAAEAADGPHVPDVDPARVRKALRLLELAEHGEVVTILPPGTGGGWKIDIGWQRMMLPCATLAEAVEAALEELKP